MIAEHSSKDLEFFMYRTFRASISSFSALRKAINAFPFFFVTVGEGASQVVYPRASHQLIPALVTVGSYRINRLLFADDLVLLASSVKGLHHALDRFSTACEHV